MFFRRKSNIIPCKECRSKIEKSFSFCPYCGSGIMTKEEEARNFGMLGRTDAIQNSAPLLDDRMGITDKILSSLMGSLMKNLEKQIREVSKAEITDLPNGIKIKIAGPGQMDQLEQQERKIIKKAITQEQLKKMSELPRSAAKTSVRRLSDKVIYELSTPGVESSKDIFISKLEQGYEIKAIGSKKIYVNSLPINLPIKKLSLDNDKLLVEFNLQ